MNVVWFRLLFFINPSTLSRFSKSFCNCTVFLPFARCFTYQWRCCFKYSRGYFVTWRSILYCKWLEKINIPPPHMTSWVLSVLGRWPQRRSQPRGLWCRGVSFMKSPGVDLSECAPSPLPASHYTGCMIINNPYYSRDVTSAHTAVVSTDGRNWVRGGSLSYTRRSPGLLALSVSNGL